MKKLFKRYISAPLHRRVLKWLGIPDIAIDAALAREMAERASRTVAENERVIIDLGVRNSANTTIIIASQIRGGMVKVLHTDVKRPDDICQIMDRIAPCWNNLRYGRNERLIMDGPFVGRDAFREYLEMR